MRINGQRVHWIDAKAYFGPAPTSRLGRDALRLWLGRTKAQARRYERSFGRGAMTFALSFHRGLDELLAAEAIVLDASVVGGRHVLDRPADDVVVLADGIRRPVPLSDGPPVT